MTLPSPHRCFSWIYLSIFLHSPSIAKAGNIYQPAAPMGTARYKHSVTALADGRALIVGGEQSAELSTSEIYDPVTKTTSPVATSPGFHIRQVVRLADDSVLALGSSQVAKFDPATNTWTAKASLTTPNYGYASTALANGKVLLTGGSSTNFLYDPKSNQWTAEGALLSSRSGHSATLLKNGKVLIVGGNDNESHGLKTVEIYDPSTGISTNAGFLPELDYHTSTLLPSGKVLVLYHLRFAGSDENGGYRSQICDPVSGSWTIAASPAHPRMEHTATLLADGTVLIGGGKGEIISEIYDPLQDRWSFADNYTVPRYGHASCLLSNGQVLVTGGHTSVSSVLNTTEVFTPSSRDWNSVTQLKVPRQSHSTTVLQDGRVLITGGSAVHPDYPDYHAVTAAAEIYDPVTKSSKLVRPMSTPRSNHPAVLLPDGDVLVIGSGAEVYHPSTNKWTATVNAPVNLTDTRALLLKDGNVIAVGGTEGPGYTRNAYLYQTKTNTWSVQPPMLSVRKYHTATLLADGRVFIHGGEYSSTYGSEIRSCEIFDPATGKWSQPNQSPQTRGGHSATLLPDGKVLICGGKGMVTRNGFLSIDPLQSAELFNPKTGTWTTTAEMSRVHMYHVANLLSDGKVLIAGGESPANWQNLTEGTSSTEVYDPKTGTWESTAAFITPRTHTSGVLLQDGKILVAGGFGPSEFDQHAQNHFVPDMEIYDPILPEISVEQPVGTVIPTSSAKSFGDVAVGASASIQFTVVNKGSAPLSGLGVSLAGASTSGFTISKSLATTTAAPGGKAVFTIRFVPTSAGSKSATLTISSNDGDEKSYVIRLSGSGFVPKPDIAIFQPADSSLTDGKGVRNFGSIQVGKTSIAKIFTIKNTGTAKLTKLSIQLDGSHKKDFITSKLSKTALAPGETTTLKVTFKPGSKDTRRTSILIRSNDPDEDPFEIKVTGTGVKK